MLASRRVHPLPLAALVTAWSLRLGTYLHRRVMGHRPEEDDRYKEMRTRCAANFNLEIFKFYQFQAVSVVILATPFLLAIGRPKTDFTALGLFAVSIVGESLADAQLSTF